MDEICQYLSTEITAHTCAHKGERQHMEDMAQMRVAKFKSETGATAEFALYAVYDGHGGSQAAKYVSEHLIDELLAHEGFYSVNPEVIKKAIAASFVITHNKMRICWRMFFLIFLFYI